MNVQINTEAGLYAIQQEGGGWSSLGFDHAFITLKALAEKLRLSIFPVESEKGTLKQYQEYRGAIEALRSRGGIKETWFHPETPEKVRKVIEKYRKSGDKLRIYYGDVETGRDWLDEFEIIGFVGRSSGLMKIPLLMDDGIGGSGMLEHCIVKMQDGNTGRVLYQNPNYHQPEFAIRNCEKNEHGHTHEVTANGEVHARFRSFGKAAAWVAFMTGASMCNPNH